MSLIGKSVGNYEIKSKLGEGGMGAVYLGEHPLIGKKVAVKVLLEEFASNESIVSRFFNEAKAVNDIGHANIVDIIDFGKIPSDGGGPLVYLVMELLDGQSLSARMTSVGISFDETRHILLQCCSALAASHKKGIVHRDLKPDNLYLCPRQGDKNFVKVLDFGIAKLTLSGASSQTRTGTIIGTPAYMSPEQCAGRGKIDHRSDVYSLGVVMYEMITGRVPFIGEGFGDIVVKQLTEAPPTPTSIRSDVPPALEAVVLRALGKNPEDRFQSMEDFATALNDPVAFMNGTTPSSKMATQFVFQPMFQDEKSQPNILLNELRGRPGFVTDNKNAARAATAISEPEAKKPRTTLSGAASEVRNQGERKRAPLLAVAAVVALAGGAIGVVALRGNHNAQPATQPPAAVVTPPPAEVLVSISLKSEPPGATVVRPDHDNATIGSTPMVIKVKKGSPAYSVQLQLEGYRPVSSTIVSDQDKEFQLTMIKDEPKPEAAAVVPAATTGKKKSRRTTPAAHHDGEDDLRTLPPVF